MTNITVKKADNATDILWTQTQSGGSDSARPAIWQSASVGSAVGHRPELRYYVKGSGPKKEVIVTSVYPSLSTDSTTGITSVIKKQRFKAVFELDQDAPQVDINEFVAQTLHMVAYHSLTEAWIQVANGNVT